MNLIEVSAKLDAPFLLLVTNWGFGDGFSRLCCTDYLPLARHCHLAQFPDLAGA